jgi:hemerythrin
MLSDQFTQIFREEHRQVRDLLLNLIPAFKDRDRDRIQSLLNQIASLTGPHFRYEEESLYPLLVDFFGGEYVEKLYCDHDRAIASAKRLVELASKESLSDADITEAVRLIRGILPHVSDCDGLSIMVETVPEEKVQTILDTREKALQEGLNLIEWSEKVRTR